jgi:hypothetical protein
MLWALAGTAQTPKAIASATAPEMHQFSLPYIDPFQ